MLAGVSPPLWRAAELVILGPSQSVIIPEGRMEKSTIQEERMDFLILSSRLVQVGGLGWPMEDTRTNLAA